jgi:hypothetical protein
MRVRGAALDGPGGVGPGQSACISVAAKRTAAARWCRAGDDVGIEFRHHRRLEARWGGARGNAETMRRAPPQQGQVSRS